MTIRYTRSTDGLNADSGLTWALAKANMAGQTLVAAGDVVWFSQVHSETTAGSVTVSAGTLAAPTRFLCGDDSAEPPTALATTAVIACTGNNSLTVGGIAYYYGIIFQCGAGGSNPSMNIGVLNGVTLLEKCQFQMLGTGGFMRCPPFTSTGSRVNWKDCDVKFSAAGILIQLGGHLHWNGGSILAGGTSPTVLFSGYASGAVGGGAGLLCENVDFSNAAATINFFDSPPPDAKLIIRNCKLPASWSGSLRNGTWTTPGRAEMYNCDSGATNYRLWIEDYFGSIRDELTLVRSGGASDGVNTLSWKMVSAANARYPSQALASPEIAMYNATTGAAKTITVEILRDSVTALNDDEIWIEVQYLGTSAAPIGSQASDAKADVLATAAAQTSSSEPWTTTGMANPNKQKLAVTVTPLMKGFYMARVMLAKASTTVYVDPFLTVT